MNWRRNRMASPRAIVSALLASFTIISSWISPAFSTALQPVGWGSLPRPQFGQQATPYSQQTISAAAPGDAAVDDAIILLDVTGSMRGEGPDPRARDIWEKTLNAVVDIVDRLALQTNLALVPFSTGPEWEDDFPGPIPSGGKLSPRQLTSDADREAFKAQLRRIVADGEATWIYESLEYSLTQMRNWREADPSRNHRQALFLYTDGIDNGPHGTLGLDGVVQMARAHKAYYPNLYLVYNDLASYLSPVQKAQFVSSGVTVTSGPPASNVELVTEQLALGNLSADANGVSGVILFRSGFADVWGRPIRLRIEEVGSSPPMAVATAVVPLSEQVTFFLPVSGPLPVGQHRARLTVEPVDGAFNLIPRNTVELGFTLLAVAAPTVLAQPSPAPTPISQPRYSLIEGIPDAFLLLGTLALLGLSAVAVMWYLELWLFKGPVLTRRLIWKLYEEPTACDEEGVRTRTLRPRRFRATEQWTIGVEGYISLPDGDSVIQPGHARVVYGGKRRPDFRIVPQEGQVHVHGKPIPAGGAALGAGSRFAVGPYHFRFDLLERSDDAPEASPAADSHSH